MDAVCRRIVHDTQAAEDAAATAIRISIARRARTPSGLYSHQCGIAALVFNEPFSNRGVILTQENSRRASQPLRPASCGAVHTRIQSAAYRILPCRRLVGHSDETAAARLRGCLWRRERPCQGEEALSGGSGPLQMQSRTAAPPGRGIPHCWRPGTGLSATSKTASALCRCACGPR